MDSLNDLVVWSRICAYTLHGDLVVWPPIKVLMFWHHRWRIAWLLVFLGPYLNCHLHLVGSKHHLVEVYVRNGSIWFGLKHIFYLYLWYNPNINWYIWIMAKKWLMFLWLSAICSGLKSNLYLYKTTQPMPCRQWSLLLGWRGLWNQSA